MYPKQTWAQLRFGHARRKS